MSSNNTKKCLKNLELVSLGKGNKKSICPKTIYDLIRLSQSYDQNSITSIYCRNVRMLKSTVKVSIETPSSFVIQNLINEFYGTESGEKITPLKYRNFFFKTKTLLIWILSVYEQMIEKNVSTFNGNDWLQISSFLPGSDHFMLKYKWFTYLKPILDKTEWSTFQEQYLLKILNLQCSDMKKFNSASKSKLSNRKIKWAKISYELSKIIENPIEFKNAKQCRERWENYMNPSLNKNPWNKKEDIRLLELSLKNPKKWVIIAKNLHGRTQHGVKNRFIRLLSRGLAVDRDTARELMNGSNLNSIVVRTLESLSLENCGICERNDGSKNDDLLKMLPFSDFLKMDGKKIEVFFNKDQDTLKKMLDP